MTEKIVATLTEQLNQIKCRVHAYFNSAISSIPPLDHDTKMAIKYEYGDRHKHEYFANLSDDLHKECDNIMLLIVNLARASGTAIRRSPLLTEADELEASCSLKGMRAALRFRGYQRTELEIEHDEDVVLGVRPSRDREWILEEPEKAPEHFERWAASLMDRFDFIDPIGAEDFDLMASASKPVAAGYRPSTAFIMMWISPSVPELVDVSDTVKTCFSEFGITARRSDDIEHEEVITQRIIDEIKTAEFLLADLTGERPSVYYEVGFAHALGRRVILYRKRGTPIHFDLAAYNCPEYDNLSGLRKMLTKRLEQVTGKPARSKG